MPEEETKDGVQKEEGKPTEEKASASKKQADPDGVIQIDVAKMYSSKRRPDVAVPGDELWSNYGRGLRYSEVESENQKLQAQKETDAGTIATQAERIAQFESDQRLAKSLEKLKSEVSGQKTVAGEQEAADWLRADDQPQGTSRTIPNSDQIASRLDEIQTELTSRIDPDKIEQTVKELVVGLYSTEQEKQAANESIKRADDTIRGAKLAHLKANMPDISEAALAEIVDVDSQYLRHARDAEQLIQQGDLQAGIETFMDGLDKNVAGQRKQLDLMQQQGKINAQRELEAELESLSGGSLPGEEAGKPREPIRKSKDAEKRREEQLEKAHKLIDRQKLRKNTAM